MVGFAALLVSMSISHPVGGAGYNDGFEVTSQTYLGYAQFTVSYNASAVASVGENLTVNAKVSVDNLTGAEDYVRDYVLIAVLLCNDHSVNSSVGSSVPTQRYLYPGAQWWAPSLSIPLTEGDTGLAPGQAVNASLTLRLVTDVSYDSIDYRQSGYAPVFGDGSSFVLIRDPGAQPSPARAPTASSQLLPLVLVGGGALLLAVTIAAYQRSRSPKT